MERALHMPASTRAGVIRLVAAILALVASLPALAQGSAPIETLDPDHLQSDFTDHVEYLLDDGWELSVEDMAGPDVAARFQRVEGTGVDFGYTKSAIWLRFAVANDGLAETNWRLFFRENFMQVFNVFRQRPDGGFTALALQGPDSAFGSRPTAHPELVVPFELDAGQTAQFYVQYWSGGSSDLDFSVLSAEDLEALYSQLSAKNFIYYGMMVILAVLSLMALVVTRSPVFLAYASYSSSALLFIVHADGNGFKYIWPEWPAFNSSATILFGSAMILSGAVFSKLFLQTYRFDRFMDWALNAVIVVVCATLLAAFFVDNQLIKKLLVLISMFGVVTFAAAGLNAARTRFKEVRFYVLAWVGALISAGIMTSRHWLGVGIPETLQFDSIRIVMVSDATLMGLAIWDRINQLRQASQAALQSSLLQARRNLQMNERMQELEQQYGLALENAERKDQQFANTLHDLRQPIFALRANVHNLAHGTGAGNASSADIETSFAYLEGLVAGHLEATRAGQADARPGASEAPEPTQIGTVFSAVHDMFAVDAAGKGLELRYVDTGAVTWINQLDLMRIVSNLVSNAVKYTDRGGVLFGCRRRPGTLRIEVHDSGPGINAEDFEQACGRAVRLEATANGEAGYGYGLSIVSELADQHGLNLTLLPGRTRGTSVTVDVPIAPAASSDAAQAAEGRAGAAEQESARHRKGAPRG